MFGTADDHLQYIDIDRFLIEVVGAQSDRLQRMFAGLVAGCDDDLRRWGYCEDFGQRGQSFGSPVWIGRKSKIDDSYRNGFLSDEIDRLQARFGGMHFVVGKGPPELTQEARIIINDQQRFRAWRHVVYVTAEDAAGSLSGTRGKITRMVVPNPFSEITSRSPAAMRISSRV